MPAPDEHSSTCHDGSGSGVGIAGSGCSAGGDPYRSGDELELTQDLDDDEEDLNNGNNKEQQQQQPHRQQQRKRKSSRRTAGSARSCEPTSVTPITTVTQAPATGDEATSSSCHLTATDRSEDEVDRSSSQEIEVI